MTLSFPRRLAFLCVASLLASTLGSAKVALGKEVQKPAKAVGFSGDPARKRGLEIGYDKGFKAGKKDKGEKLKPDPSRHAIYQDPKKEYRSEYGSTGSFFAGFRSGFLGGYKQAFGGSAKIKMEAVGASGSLVPAKTGSKESTPSKTRPSTVSSDAL